MRARLMKHEDVQHGDSVERLRGFDDYAVTLGDEMRGRRAAMGRSLLDVERDLHIRAVLIDAIEKADPEAFEAAWLISGHVRSYARYLEMDPDDVYSRFCQESGCEPHRMITSQPKRTGSRSKAFSLFNWRRRRKIQTQPGLNQLFDPERNRLAFDALGSSMVLLALTGGIIYVGWAVYDEVQRVVSADEGAFVAVTEPELVPAPAGPLGTGNADPVLSDPGPILWTSNDSIGNIDPNSTGFFAVDPAVPEPVVEVAVATVPESSPNGEQAATEPTVVALPANVVIVPSRPSWIRVTGDDGSVLFEKVLASGEQYAVPGQNSSPRLRAGNSGSLYFLVGDEIYGPAGSGQRVVKNIELTAGSIRTQFGRMPGEAVPQEIHDSIRYSEAIGRQE